MKIKSEQLPGNITKMQMSGCYVYYYSGIPFLIDYGYKRICSDMILVPQNKACKEIKNSFRIIKEVNTYDFNNEYSEIIWRTNNE